MTPQLLLRLTLLTILLPLCGFATQLDDVQQLQWQSRVILIHSIPQKDSPIQALEAAKAEIDERHLHWFVVYGGQLQTNYPGPIHPEFATRTINRYFPEKVKSVLLIGKDGDIKLRSDHLNLQHIFQLIDQMPMRQSEMNQ